ncbi:MAG: hypothetical protein APF81_20695 [Desulfosporosinus sp. BRH_c37]|nr:MAG: hypothetical protein APF81_20695 [Desulfosporosinus sp. BRH_c37]
MYEHYFPRIYSYVRCRVNNPAVSDDLTSTIFEKVLSRLDSYSSDRGTFSTWLFTIAHNVVVDYFKEPEHSAVCLEMAHEVVSPEPDPQDQIVALLTNEQLIQALQQLTERERNIISLKFWGGLTNRNIASLTGLSESNVGIILYRSMQRLRSLLD